MSYGSRTQKCCSLDQGSLVPPTSLNDLPYQVGEDGPHILQQLASSGLDSLKGTRVQICAPNFDVFLQRSSQTLGNQAGKTVPVLPELAS